MNVDKIQQDSFNEAVKRVRETGENASVDTDGNINYTPRNQWAEGCVFTSYSTDGHTVNDAGA